MSPAAKEPTTEMDESVKAEAPAAEAAAATAPAAEKPAAKEPAPGQQAAAAGKTGTPVGTGQPRPATGTPIGNGRMPRSAVTRSALNKAEHLHGELPVGLKSVWIIGHAKENKYYIEAATRMANWLQLEYKLIDINPPSFITSLLRLKSMPTKYSTDLIEPWPDVIITAGPTAAGVIPSLKKVGIKSFCMHIGAPLYDWKNYDATLVPDHFLPSKNARQHPRVIPYRIGFSSLSMEEYRRVENSRETRKLRLEMPLPRLFAVIGAGNQSYTLNARTARRIGKRLVEAVDKKGGSLMVMALPGTPPDVVLALRNEVRGEHSLFWGSPEDGPTPYNRFLGAASQIAVTWESPQRLVDACNTKKAVYLLPLPPRRNWRGVRQDQTMHHIHEQLLDGHHARIFSGTLKGFVPTPLNEMDRVGKLVQEQWREYTMHKQIPAQPRPPQTAPSATKPSKTPENAES